MNSEILVTGSAGFIGFHLTLKLLEAGKNVIGLDNINDYYDPELKYNRLSQTGIRKSEISEDRTTKSIKYPNYKFYKSDLSNKKVLDKIFKKHKITKVVNLAAQAGVRYSLSNPHAYLNSNMEGFLNILETCRHHAIKHLVFASSSSVYGLNKQMPFSVQDNVDHPVSLYAASKKSNELMAHSYSYLYDLPVTGLRFFTVYGPWGRPDMALFLFVDAILKDKPIHVFNNGQMKRDFTYIDDIVQGIIRVLDKPAQQNSNWNGLKPDPSSSSAAYRIYNIGNNKPVHLLDFIKAIENSLGKTAMKIMKPMQAGDVPETWADVNELVHDIDYMPGTDIDKGVKNFVDWYFDYYGENRP